MAEVPFLFLIPPTTFLPFFLSFCERARSLDDDHPIFCKPLRLFNRIWNALQNHFSRVRARSFCSPCPSQICARLSSAPVRRHIFCTPTSSIGCIGCHPRFCEAERARRTNTERSVCKCQTRRFMPGCVGFLLLTNSNHSLIYLLQL